jgi:hypothetical protein
MTFQCAEDPKFDMASSPQTVADVLEILKEERGTFLRNVAE